MEDKPQSISNLKNIYDRLTDIQKAQVKTFQEIAGSVVAGFLLGDLSGDSLRNLVIKDANQENPVSAIIIPGSIEDIMPKNMN